MSTGESRPALCESAAYKQFRAWVARQRVDVLEEGESWRYYDFGPKTTTAAASSLPLLLLGGVCGTAESFFAQFVSLCPKGYRLVAAQPEGAAYGRADDYARGLNALLAKLGVARCHVFGAGLGGFLAQVFAARHPARVASLLLCNAFVDTQHYVAQVPCPGALQWAPEFLLKRHLLAALPAGPQAPCVADAVDFVAAEVDASARRELLTRLLLSCTPAVVDPQKTLPPERVTVIASGDACVQPPKLREDVRKFYPEARFALLRVGGDFPWLSNPDEVSMLIEVHLRAANALEEQQREQQQQQ